MRLLVGKFFSNSGYEYSIWRKILIVARMGGIEKGDLARNKIPYNNQVSPNG